MLRCLDVPIMMKSVLLAFYLHLLFVIQPEISLRQSSSCFREGSVTVVDKDMYTWVSSAYNWWSNWWMWMSELSDLVYRVNSSGPRTEPWGTLYSINTGNDNSPSTETVWKHLLRYDVIHARGIPVIPKCCSNHSRSVWWSMVSNAVDRSSMISTDTQPLSRESKISLFTLSNPVSVEWNFR